MSAIWIRLLLLIALLVGLASCTSNHVSPQTSQPKKEPTTTATKGADSMSSLTLMLEDRSYQLKLVDNETTRALVKQLPLQFKMQDLNHNEKFFELAFDLPTEETAVHRINKGDVMLYGSRTLVVFYKDFKTSYSYTRIGKLTPLDLAVLQSRKSVQVTLK